MLLAEAPRPRAHLRPVWVLVGFPLSRAGLVEDPAEQRVPERSLEELPDAVKIGQSEQACKLVGVQSPHLSISVPAAAQYFSTASLSASLPRQASAMRWRTTAVSSL